MGINYPVYRDPWNLTTVTIPLIALAIAWKAWHGKHILISWTFCALLTLIGFAWIPWAVLDPQHMFDWYRGLIPNYPRGNATYYLPDGSLVSTHSFYVSTDLVIITITIMSSILLCYSFYHVRKNFYLMIPYGKGAEFELEAKYERHIVTQISKKSNWSNIAKVIPHLIFSWFQVIPPIFVFQLFSWYKIQQGLPAGGDITKNVPIPWNVIGLVVVGFFTFIISGFFWYGYPKFGRGIWGLIDKNYDIMFSEHHRNDSTKFIGLLKTKYTYILYHIHYGAIVVVYLLMQLAFTWTNKVSHIYVVIGFNILFAVINWILSIYGYFQNTKRYKKSMKFIKEGEEGEQYEKMEGEKEE